MTTRRRLLAILGLVVGAAIVVAVLRARSHAPAPAAATAATPTPGSAAVSRTPHNTPAVPTLQDEAKVGARPAPAQAGSALRGIGFESPRSLSKIPERYELSILGGRAFVNLAGGPSQLHPGGGGAPNPPMRAVRGRVIDAKDRPVAGAVVVFDDRLYVMAGHVTGKAGATTDANGEFSSASVPEGAMRAVAFHPSGWSNVVEVGSAPLVLELRGRGALRGRATYNGQGESFDLQLKPRTEHAIAFHYQTDPDGGYTIASLPPGDYTVAFTLAQTIAGGVSKRIERDVTIVDGATADLDVAQTSAAEIVVAPNFPAGLKPETVQFWLFPGDKGPANAAEARTRGRAEHVPGILFGGVDAMTPNQFHDVTSGTYVACVSVDSGALFGCAKVVVVDGQEVREVRVQLAAPSTSN